MVNIEQQKRRELLACYEVFKTQIASLAHSQDKPNNEVESNDESHRLYTEVAQFLQLELVFGKIEGQGTYFEEELWDLTSEIKEATGTPGIVFSPFDIMQLIYLLECRTTLVDEAKVNQDNINLLIEKLPLVSEVLPHFFKMFFYEYLHITAKRLIPRRQAILPMLAYVVTLRTNGYEWKPEQIDICSLKEYFTKSQLCDWNSQDMFAGFSLKAIESAEKGEAFPLSEIIQMAIEGER